MKWTADNDRLLLMKLIETHDISVKAEKIREAWPKDGREVPTARAIREHIVKIKNVLKTPTSGSVPSTPRKRKGPESVASTPRTTKARKAVHENNGSKSPTSGVRKSGARTATGTGSESEETTSDSHKSGVFCSFDGFEEEGQTIA